MSNRVQPPTEPVQGLLGQVRSRSAGELGLLVLAAAALVLARVLLQVVPVRWLLGRPAEAAEATALDEPDRATVRRVGWAVGAVVRHAPFSFVCFPQCLAGRWLLSAFGIPSRLFYGVARDHGHLETHTWLECGDRVLLGGEEAGRFVAIAVYAGGRERTGPA